MRHYKSAGLGIIVMCFFIFPFTGQASEDTAPPDVTALDITPDTVNTELENQALTLTLTLTDNQAGVCIANDCGNYHSSETQLRLIAPGGEQTIDFAAFTRTLGDDQNGTYSGTATLPRYSQNGIWEIDHLLLVDKLGNYTSLSGGDLETEFGDGIGDVNNVAIVDDTTAPAVTAFSLSPSTINTDDADAEVALSITLTDDLAGVCIASDCAEYNSSETQLRLVAPEGAQSITVSTLTRTSGDDLSGTYTGTAVFPQGSVGGTWTADYQYLVDKIGNNQYLDKADLEAAFGEDVADIVNSATNTDQERPQITAFEITPTEINTSDENQILTLTMTLTDNAAGVCIPGDCGEYYNSSETQLRLQPLIGTQYIDFAGLTRLSGDSLSGEYQATATVPRSSKEGLWQVSTLFLVDKLGNYESLDADDLNDLFPNASGLTITNTAEASSVTIERDWTITSTKASATFVDGTVVTKKEGGRFEFYRMVNQTTNIETLTDENLYGDPVRTIRFGIPGLNLEFSQNVSLSITVGAEYEGRVLQIQALGEDEDAWANETECTVTDAKCSFTVDHATYYTANALPRSPIVVGARAGGSPRVAVWSSAGKLLASFNAYASTFRGGISAIMADLNDDGEAEIITAPYSAGGPHIRVFTAKGKPITNLFPFSSSYRGGLSIAAGDIDHDGRNELVVATSTGGDPKVRTYDYRNKQLELHSAWRAYATTYRGGVTLALGDVNNDGRDEIVTATNAGAAPHVRVFNSRGQVLGQFYAFTRTFRGGVNITLADINGDAKADIITTPKSDGIPQVRVFRPNGTLVRKFFAYPSTWRLGLKVGVGDYDSDGKVDIITAPSNGGPHIRVFNRAGELKNQFMAYAESFRGGVDLQVADVDGDGHAEIVTGPLGQSRPVVKVFNYGAQTKNFTALRSDFLGGVNLSVSQ